MSTRSPKTETQRKRRREGQDAPNSRARSKERRKKQRKKESKHNRWKRKLFTAVEIADCDKVERLIHQRSRKHIKEYLAEFNAQGLSAIHLAAGLGFVQICRVLLSYGVEINALSSDGSTPIHYACLNEQIDTVAFFVKHSAAINIANSMGIQPTDLGVERFLRKAQEAATLKQLEREFEEELRHEQEQEAKERREWEERLAQEYASEDGFSWQDEWGREEADGTEEKRVEDMSEEEWKDYVASQMRSRRSFPSNYQTKQQKEQEERDKMNARVSQKIAEEEQEKERQRQARRAEVNKQRTEDFEARWRDFEAVVGDDSFGPKLRIRLKDIPFPDIEQDEKNEHTLGGFNVLAEDLTLEEKKKALRGLFLRWHPDKFTQRYGHLLHEADREPIMDMITRITQHIAKIKGTLNTLG